MSREVKNMLSLRSSAYLCDLCVKNHSNAEIAEIRREPQRIRSFSIRVRVLPLLPRFLRIPVALPFPQRLHACLKL